MDRDVSNSRPAYMGDITKILIVDDEAQMRRVLRRILTAHGYAVETAEDGDSALELIKEWQPGLLLTDLQMPRINGLELCRLVRSVSSTPIIVLSVAREQSTIVGALDAGADDYVTKPFGSSELLARIRSLLRRAHEEAGETVERGDFRIDVSGHVATVRDNRLRLTPKEFDLLICLVRNSEKILTHSFLLNEVWGHYYTEHPESLRVLVGTLRKKIEPDPANPRYLITEPWIGYRFVPAGL